MKLAAQLIGIVASAVAILSFQNKTQKKIVLFQLASTTLFCIHFTMLGAYSGAILNAVAAVRSLVFSQKEKKWAQSRVWLVVFAAASVAVGVLTGGGEGWLCVLPVVGMLFTTAAFWIEDAEKVRWVALPSSPCWLIYNVIHGSIAGVITESFAMGSILVAQLRYHWLPALRAKRQAKPEITD